MGILTWDRARAEASRNQVPAAPLTVVHGPAMRSSSQAGMAQVPKAWPPDQTEGQQQAEQP